MRAGLLALLVCTPCFAHHGVAPHYDVTKPVRLEGKVARFEFINPHSFVYYRGALTEAGERARAAFDPVKDDPAIYCDPASPVRFWVNVNEPFEIVRGQDALVIEHRFMDSRRVVHLSAAPPADAPRGTMGWSIGRFDGATLVVTTDHFNAATLEPRYGVLHTQDLKLTERLAVNAAGELEITWVIDDPAYFKQPVTQTEVFVRSRRDPAPYDCKPGYRQ